MNKKSLDRYYISQREIEKYKLLDGVKPGDILGSRQKHRGIAKDGICPCLTSAMGMGGGHIPMIVVIKDKT
jgi:hypothetical protein